MGTAVNGSSASPLFKSHLSQYCSSCDAPDPHGLETHVIKQLHLFFWGEMMISINTCDDLLTSS